MARLPSVGSRPWKLSHWTLLWGLPMLPDAGSNPAQHPREHLREHVVTACHLGGPLLHADSARTLVKDGGIDPGQLQAD